MNRIKFFFGKQRFPKDQRPHTKDFDFLDQFYNFDDDPPLAPREGLLCFIVVQIRDDDLDILRDIYRQVITILLSHGAIVSWTASCLVMATLSSPESVLFGKQGDSRHSVVATELRRAFPDKIKIVHGSAIGQWGLLGSDEFSSYGAILPSFSMILKELADMEYGEVK